MLLNMPIMLLLASLLAPAPRIDGVALSLYYEDAAQGMSFKTMVNEIADLGATHISVLVQWAQSDTRSTLIQPHPKETPSDEVVKSVIKQAKSRGLRVMLFPILWVEQRSIGDWRGTLKPEKPDAWWAAYDRFIMHYAQLAQGAGVDILSIGSELGSLEGETVRWTALAGRARERFKGKLIYSANWDHYDKVTFWDAVDFIGMTAYYRLATNNTPTQEELIESWQKVRLQVLDWHDGQRKPLIFTELGYPSADGAASHPWDYTQTHKKDLDEQRMCFEAFRRVWQKEKRLGGVFFWNWWGPGDGNNTWYTIKGKPALSVLQS